MILGLDSRVVGLTSSSAVRLRAVGADQALVAAFASGAVDWAVWSRRPPLALLTELDAACAARPVAAVCIAAPARGRLEVISAGWAVREVSKGAGVAEGTQIGVGEARQLWLRAWAGVLCGSGSDRYGPGGALARQLLLGVVSGAACPATVADVMPVLGVGERTLRRRLVRAGFRGPSRFLMVGRCFRAWEAARLGMRTMGSMAADLGYGGLWSLDRALVQVLGVTARELGSLTDLELAGWLREALRRPPDDRQGVELTENE